MRFGKDCRRSLIGPDVSSKSADGVVQRINKSETLRSNLFCDRRLILSEGRRWRDVTGEQSTQKSGDNCKSDTQLFIR